MHTQKIASIFAIIIVLALSLGACQPQPAVVETVVVTQVVTEREEVIVTQEVVVTQEIVVTPEPQMEETTLERVQREGVVRVGFANENPYAFAQPDGTLSGEAVEVARAVLSALGINEMEGVLTQFGSLIPGLQARRFDVITAGMFINPTRCEQVLFADPEYKIGEGLIVEAGNPLDLHSYEDIAANPAVRVGTGAGYLEFDYLLAVGVSEDQITTYPDDPSGVAGLQAGQIDAWTATTPTLLKVLETTGDPNLEMADPFTDPVIDGQPVTGYGAAAFRPEDQDFRDAFNAELQNLKDSGELVEIISQFEGFGPQNDPGDATADELCQP
jgi:polar amino acid transport system substrate-binding protein